jgi:hypothetical protein
VVDVVSTALPEAVFLDAQVFERASFNFSSTQFASLQKHLETGRLRLILTDITVTEVKCRIDETVRKEVAAHAKLAKASRVLRSSQLAKPALSDLDQEAVVKELHDALNVFLEDNKAEIIDTSEQEAGPVFERYFAGKPPFNNTVDKRYEFPDAFAIDALKQWTDDNGEELFAVSEDKLFQQGCAECPDIHVKSTLVEMLDHVASDDERVAEFIREQLKARAGKIGKEAASQFEELGFHLVDEWGDIEVEVTNTTLTDEPEIVDIGVKEANAQMVFEADYNAYVSYEDSTSGVYDSEEGRMMFMETRNVTARKTHELVVDLHINFSGFDPDEFDVDEVILVEPASGIRIRVPERDWEDD